jgi:hypothetical protein
LPKTTKEIADRLVDLCRKGQFEATQKELFSTDAVNIEPYATPGFPVETKGLAAILEKGRTFTAMIEQVHTLEVSDPLVATNSFACTMRLDLSIKGHGRKNMFELCVTTSKTAKSCASSFTNGFPFRAAGRKSLSRPALRPFARPDPFLHWP